jgi:integrase
LAKQLTAAAVLRLRPRSYQYEVRDAGAAGLYLCVFASGVKSWVLRFRRPDGRTAKLSLGRADLSGRQGRSEPTIGDPLTVAEARWLAAEVNRRRASGRDVVVEQHRARSDTFAAAALLFVEEHVRKTRRWRETARILGLAYPVDGGEPTVIAGSLAARWARKPITEVDAAAIYSVIDETRRRGIPGMGARNGSISDSRGRLMSRTLSKMFSWLTAHRRVDVNPCAGVWCPPAPPSRDRVLSPDEVKRLWRACDEAGDVFGPMIKVLLLTGCRLREVASMERTELNGATWTIPGTRTKNHRAHLVPLTTPVINIIDSVPTIEDCRFIFSTNGRTPVSGFSKLKRRLDGAMEASGWRLHDLRRTCATGMASLKIPPHVIEACLNHVSGFRASVAGTYNVHEYLDEKRDALRRWAKHVESIVGRQQG